MTPAQIADLELAVDQARDATANLQRAVHQHAPNSAGLAFETCEAMLHLDFARATIQNARCDRMPCDRMNGVCPRCQVPS